MPVLLFIRLLLHISVVAVIGWGLYLNLYGAWGAFQSWLLLFYTTLSNILVMLLFAWLCISDIRQLKQALNRSSRFVQTRRANHPPHTPPFKMALTWTICITGIVWHALLVPHLQSQSVLEVSASMQLSIELLHTWSPLLIFIDWLLFDPKGSIHWLAPWSWLLIPLSYLAFICGWVHWAGPVNAQYGLIYPYPFIDFATYGSAVVWQNIGIISGGMLVLGYLFYLLDLVLGKLFPPRRPRTSF